MAFEHSKYNQNIRIMKTVGIMLKEARLAKGIALEEVEKQTKIRLKFLEAIERDEYTILPSPIYAKGFVKNYSQFLGLDVHMVMAFFRRQTDEIKRSSILPHKSPELDYKKRFITPNRFISVVFIGLSLLFISYFVIQYRKLQLPPTLTITRPQAESILKEKKLDILGTTDPDATIMVNGLTVTVRSDGQFFTQISLDPGVNTITTVATSRFGKTQTDVRKVGFQQ